MGRHLKFAGYIHNHKILPGNVFGLILKNKIANMGVSFQSWKGLISTLLLVLQVWHVKPIYRNSWAGNLLKWSDLTLGPSFKVNEE